MVADREEIDVLKEDHAKKMVGARVRRQQVAYAKGEACPAAARVPYSRSRDPRSAMYPGSSPATRRCSRRCVRWPPSIRGTAIGRSGSSSAPQFLHSDNGPEFVATAILHWLDTAQIETAFIDPGKPWQNGADESFNGKFRDQHLSLQWFRNRGDAKVSIEAWRRHYNEVRPHSSLGYLTPAAFKAKHVADVEGGRAPAMPARANKITEERLTDRPGVILQQRLVRIACLPE